MKAVLRIEYALPEPNADGCDGVELEAEIEIPFIPLTGMMLAPLMNGDFHKVLEVYWRVDESDRIDVYLEQGLSSLDLLRKQGWEEVE